MSSLSIVPNVKTTTDRLAVAENAICLIRSLAGGDGTGTIEDVRLVLEDYDKSMKKVEPEEVPLGDPLWFRDPKF